MTEWLTAWVLKQTPLETLRGSFSQRSNNPMSSEVLSSTSKKAEQAFPLFDSWKTLEGMSSKEKRACVQRGHCHWLLLSYTDTLLLGSISQSTYSDLLFWTGRSAPVLWRCDRHQQTVMWKINQLETDSHLAFVIETEKLLSDCSVVLLLFIWAWWPFQCEISFFRM